MKQVNFDCTPLDPLTVSSQHNGYPISMVTMKDRKAYTIQPTCDSNITLHGSKWHKVLLRVV